MENSYFIFDSPKDCASSCVGQKFDFEEAFLSCVKTMCSCEARVFIQTRVYVRDTACRDGDSDGSLLLSEAFVIRPDVTTLDLLQITPFFARSQTGPLTPTAADIVQCMRGFVILGCQNSACECSNENLCGGQNLPFDHLPNLPRCPLLNLTEHFFYNVPSLAEPFGSLRSWSAVQATPEVLALGFLDDYKIPCMPFRWDSVHLRVTSNIKAVPCDPVSTAAPTIIGAATISVGVVTLFQMILVSLALFRL